eukprot:TRINITY_DN1873_c0_g1_i1.p5 TRINITY_DN1873_c0_g1~~TRINITY_DN1873_c0_g1_i1.p5  ORF type:complete len:152 (+),score=16.18 TRINITY_DN1873_c0_g1_i1:1068-1523(+)
MAIMTGQIRGCNFSVQRNRTCQKRRFTTRAVEEEVSPSLQRPTLNRPTLKTEEAAGEAAETRVAPSKSVVTIEFQRRMAKEMTSYFRNLKEEEAISQSQVFGFTLANEINNGRWVMMGLAIGLLTEYSTGVNFIDQLKLMVSYLGIADIYD